MKKNALVILCAGSGKRMRAQIPKMLLNLKGRSILFWTLRCAVRSEVIGSIVLTYPADWAAAFKSEVARTLRQLKIKKPITLVVGGKERTDSTQEALKVLERSVEWVGIHDGARPFLREKLLRELFASAQKTGVAIPVVPAKDTIKRVDQDGFVKETLPREELVQVQTPQVLRRDIAEKIHGLNPDFALEHELMTKNPGIFLSRTPRAYPPVRSRHSSQKYSQDFCPQFMSNAKSGLKGSGQKKSHRRKKINFTDDASLAEFFGYPVRTVLSDYENIKITTPEDLVLGEQILRKFKT